MKKTLRRIFTLFLTVIVLLTGTIPICAEEIDPQGNTEGTAPDLGISEGMLHLDCKSAILMEANTGTVLYEQNVHEALPPASVTKIMTLLLVMEALEDEVVRLDSTITVSANAASMGGSQVYQKEGEQMSLEDLLKSVVIASANDAAVALAEYVAGSVPAFVEKMNKRAGELGMQDTVFENVTGLDDTAERHLTSANDIAIMSRALIAHEDILKYSSIWMDTIRNGEFGLTNTNRLVRFYPGCTGLKTGSTSLAGFCVSVTAERENTSLICVIMGAESRDSRNAIATQLLDWGFSSFGVYEADGGELDPLQVVGGTASQCPISYDGFRCVLPRAAIKQIQVKHNLIGSTVSAPVHQGDILGYVEYYQGEQKIGSVPILAQCDVPRIGFFGIFKKMMASFLLI